VVEIVATLPGGKRVDAQVGHFTVHTDQPRESGGEDSAPDPFALFLASLATCAGFYVGAFCAARRISTDGIRIIEHTESDAESKRLVRVTLEIELPPSFPAQYRDAVVRAAGACKVKKALLDPPELRITVQPR
jgi:ribosomal protein S12 methylthiotransferase accessory factor